MLSNTTHPKVPRATNHGPIHHFQTPKIVPTKSCYYKYICWGDLFRLLQNLMPRNKPHNYTSTIYYRRPIQYRASASRQKVPKIIRILENSCERIRVKEFVLGVPVRRHSNKWCMRCCWKSRRDWILQRIV